MHVVQPLHWFGSVGLVEHAMWLRLACYNWFDCLGLIEHTRWLRLACCTGFCIGFVTGVCNAVGFRVVCFVQGIPLVLVFGLKPMFGVWMQGYVSLLVLVLCVLYQGPGSL